MCSWEQKSPGNNRFDLVSILKAGDESGVVEKQRGLRPVMLDYHSVACDLRDQLCCLFFSQESAYYKEANDISDLTILPLFPTV